VCVCVTGTRPSGGRETRDGSELTNGAGSDVDMRASVYNDVVDVAGNELPRDNATRHRYTAVIAAVA